MPCSAGFDRHNLMNDLMICVTRNRRFSNLIIHVANEQMPRRAVDVARAIQVSGTGAITIAGNGARAATAKSDGAMH